MIVVDASCLYEALAAGRDAQAVGERLSADPDQAAPHLIDAEVLSVILRDFRRGLLDRTAAWEAIEDLGTWPGQRYSHRALLSRVWELRGSLRPYDALYVALAEALDATLVTLDRRLARAAGPRCAIEVVGS